MAKSPDSLLRQLRVRYIAALGLIAALILAGQFLIQLFLNQHAGNAQVTNLVSSQIALCREVSRDATSFQFASNPRHLDRLAQDMANSLEPLQKNHRTLKENAGIQSVDDTFESSFEKIAEIYKELRDGFRSVRAPSYDRLYLAQELSKHLDTYRSGLEDAFTAFQEVNRNKIRTLQITELILVVLTIGVLILEGFFVFHPAIKSLEASLATVLEARAEAERALRIKSDFLGKMSHEIKNPLNAIVGMSELMLDTRLSPDQKRFSNILFRSASGLRALLESLLDFSKIEAQKLALENVAFDLFPVVEKSVDMVAPAAHEKGLELIVDVEPALCFRTQGDPTRLQQVIINLLSNAAKFTKQGEIVLAVTQGKSDPSCVRFSVRDSGCGIKAEEKARIFEEFSQANAAVTRMYGGTGLGLAISKQIVEAWGGKLDFTSESEKGSEFFFELPLKNIGQTELQKAFAKITKLERTLVISPNTALRENIGAYLKGVATVAMAPSQEIAMELLKESEASKMYFHNVLLDSRLVEATLLSFVQTLRSRHSNAVNVILLLSTAHASEQILLANYYGITRFLFKPLSPFQLLKELNERPGYGESDDESTPSRVDYADKRPVRVLAVDDSRDNRYVLEAYFSQADYLVDYAKNGELALQQYRSQHYDIVLMDIEMPVMGGYEAASKIRELQQETTAKPASIVALSAYDVEAGKKHLFDAQIKKPVDRGTLFKTVQKLTTHIKPFDSATLDKEEASIQSQVAALVPKYIENRKREFKELGLALTEKRFDDIARVGHNLKGSAPSYGFPELAKLGDQLYEAARSEDSQAIRKLIDRMKQVVH